MAEAPRRFPVFLDLTARLAVVVGGGKAAERKARSLVAHGADVVVVAPEITERLEEMSAEQQVTVERRDYVRGDLEGAMLAIAVSGSEETDRAVHAEAMERDTLVNVAGVPDLSTFAFPSVVERGAFQLAISTGGISPEVARAVRRRLADEFGPEWERFVELAAEVRALASERIEDGAERKAVLDAVAASDLPARLAAGESPMAEDVLAEFTEGR